MERGCGRDRRRAIQLDADLTCRLIDHHLQLPAAAQCRNRAQPDVGSRHGEPGYIIPQCQDRFGHAGVNSAGAGGAAGFDFNGFGNLNDIFETFFAGSNGSQRRSGPQRGADLRYELTISFEEAVFGCQKEIELPRWEACSVCRGNGAHL